MTVAVRHRDRDPLLRQCCDEGPCTHAWCGLAGLFALYFIAFGKAAHHLCSLAGSFAWGLRARARLPRLHLLLTRSRFACLEEDAMCSQGRPVAAQDTRSRVAAFSGGCWPAAGCGDRHHAARWHRGPCNYYVPCAAAWPAACCDPSCVQQRQETVLEELAVGPFYLNRHQRASALCRRRIVQLLSWTLCVVV